MMTDNPLTPAFDAITARLKADAERIAELEAENERLKRNWQTEADARVEDITRAEQAEAKLEALNKMLMTLFMEERDSASDRGQVFFMPSDIWLADLRAHAEEGGE